MYYKWIFKHLNILIYIFFVMVFGWTPQFFFSQIVEEKAALSQFNLISATAELLNCWTHSYSRFSSQKCFYLQFMETKMVTAWHTLLINPLTLQQEHHLLATLSLSILVDDHLTMSSCSDGILCCIQCTSFCSSWMRWFWVLLSPALLVV